MLMEDKLLRTEFCDHVPEHESVLCWTFNRGTLEKEGYGCPSVPVYRALMQGLKELADSERISLREQQFFIWTWERSGLFRLAACTGITDNGAGVLCRIFAKVPAFLALEAGKMPSPGMVPVLAYDHGVVVEYGPPEHAGSEYHDPESGCLVQGRVCDLTPTPLLRGEG